MSDISDDDGMQSPIFKLLSNETNNVMGNNITEQEIQKHKDKLNNLIFRLYNTHNIDEENSINNEIKNESEFLSSLFNIKRNELNQNNNMNNNNNNNNLFNPMPNPIINDQMQQQMMQQQILQQQMLQQQMMQQQILQQQMMQQQMEMQNQYIRVIFRQNGENSKNIPPITIQCKLGDSVSSMIEKYRNASGDKDPYRKFIYNAKSLDPFLTLSSSKISDNSNIFVVSTRGIKKDENNSK